MGRGVGGGGRGPVDYNPARKSLLEKALDGWEAMIKIREKGGVANDNRRPRFDSSGNPVD